MPSVTRIAFMRFARLLLLIPTGTLAGGLSGALVNIVNIRVVPRPLWGLHTNLSPLIVDLQLPLHLKIILQGALEGSVLGTFAGFWFAVTVMWVSRLSCPFSMAMRYIPFGAMVGLLCSVCGGIDGVLFATLKPTTVSAYLSTNTRAESVALSWALGSTYGGYLGGVVSFLAMNIFFIRRWKSIRAHGTV